MMALHEQAYEHIKKMIVNGDLSYHEIYSETKIAKEIGVSRTPFRDAIHRLVQEGYIDIIPSKGFQLHQLTIRDVEETFQVRSALECYCTLEITKLYQTERAAALFRELRFLLDNLKRILDTSHSIEEFLDYDFAFHIKIIDFLDNEQFTSLFHTFMYRMKRLAALSLSHENRMEDTYREHKAIYDTMKAGNFRDIYETTLEHMNTPKWINLDDLKADRS